MAVMNCIVVLLFPSSYNLDTRTWDAVPTSSGPLYRYGHSLTLYQVNINIYCW